MRAFIAITVPENIIHDLINIQKYVIANVSDTKYLKFVNPDSFHITLKFLGDAVEPDLFKEIYGRITPVKDKLNSFNILADSFNFGFDGQRNPSVLLLKFQENKGLKFINDQIDLVVNEYGFIPDKDEFTPHITIARTRRFVPLNINKEIKDLTRNLEFDIKFKIEKISFIESIRSYKGAIYNELFKVDLK